MLINIFLWSCKRFKILLCAIVFHFPYRCLFEFYVRKIYLSFNHRWYCYQTIPTMIICIIRLNTSIPHTHTFTRMKNHVQCFEMKFDAEYWIRYWIPFTTANPGREEKITTLNSVDEEKLLRVNWEWSEAQAKAQPCEML